MTMKPPSLFQRAVVCLCFAVLRRFAPLGRFRVETKGKT